MAEVIGAFTAKAFVAVLKYKASDEYIYPMGTVAPTRAEAAANGVRIAAGMNQKFKHKVEQCGTVEVVIETDAKTFSRG